MGLRDNVVEEHSLVQELGFVPLSKTGAELLFGSWSPDRRHTASKLEDGTSYQLIEGKPAIKPAISQTTIHIACGWKSHFQQPAGKTADQSYCGGKGSNGIVLN